MTILVTNIANNSLTDDIIKESFEKSKNKNKNNIDTKITKIISLRSSDDKNIDWKLDINKDVPVEEHLINNIEDMEEALKEIDSVIDPLFVNKEYKQVIVDSSIFGFYILNSMKKFDVKEVFILKNGELDRFQTCICDD